MALILAAPLLTVARLILSKGVRQASKKYGPKLIKKTKDYISKNKLIWDGKKIIKPKAGSIKTVRPTNKKPTTTKKPDALDKKADDIIKRVENAKDGTGEKILNNLDKSGTLFNYHIKGKFRTPQVFKKYIKDALKDRKNPRLKNKNKKLADEKKPINQNIQTKDQLKKSLSTKKKITGGAIIAAGIGLPFLKGGDKKSSTEPSNFAQAFRQARKEKGTDSTFTYKGKQYSTVTMDEVKKAGFNSLREYLNAKKKK